MITLHCTTPKRPKIKWANRSRNTIQTNKILRWAFEWRKSTQLPWLYVILKGFFLNSLRNTARLKTVSDRNFGTVLNHRNELIKTKHTHQIKRQVATNSDKEKRIYFQPGSGKWRAFSFSDAIIASYLRTLRTYVLLLNRWISIKIKP